MADWFSNIAKQAMQAVDNFADTLVEQANAAQDQITAEQKKVAEEASRQKGSTTVDADTEIRLPWEIDDESKAILSQDLMEKVLSLSLTEQNFSVEPPNVILLQFSFSTVVPIAMKLLEIDTNLGRMHAKLSPKMDEEVFWRHYFFRIEYLKAFVGLSSQKPTIIVTLKKIKFDDIIFKPTFVPPPPPPPPPAVKEGVPVKPTVTATVSAGAKSKSTTSSSATTAELSTPGKASKVALTPVMSATKSPATSTTSTPVKSPTPGGVSKTKAVAAAAAAAAVDDSDAWDDLDVDLDEEEEEEKEKGDKNKDKTKIAVQEEEEKKKKEDNAKLAKAVRKELDVSDLDLGDLDDFDLADVEADFDNLDIDEDLDAELEAQIAKELEEDF